MFRLRIIIDEHEFIHSPCSILCYAELKRIEQNHGSKESVVAADRNIVGFVCNYPHVYLIPP